MQIIVSYLYLTNKPPDPNIVKNFVDFLKIFLKSFYFAKK